MSDPNKEPQWFFRPKPRPAAALKLFCFPFAGGGPEVYRTWPDHLPETVDVRSIHYPGRGTRLRERPFIRIKPMAKAIGEAMRVHLDDGPYVIFGHSLGALIAYETARYLQSVGAPSPKKLFVSAHRAPQRPPRHASVHLAPEEVFLDRLRGLGGTPAMFYESRELKDMLLPMLRADFGVLESYRYVDGETLSCPLVAYGSYRDSEASRADIAAWEDYSEGPFQMRMFEGGHFYWNDDPADVTRSVVNDLEGVLV